MGKGKRKHRIISGYFYDFGKLLVGISKLTFGSLVLGTVIRWDIPHADIFVLGVFFSTVGAAFGIILARLNKER